MAEVTTTSENEIWKPVVGYEAAYEVSSLGRVRSITRWGYGKNKCLMLLHGQMLKPHVQNGYHLVGLHLDGKKKTTLVNRIVCIAFHGPPPFDGAHAAHGDGVRTNNRHDNLRWATAKENSADKELHGNTLRGSRAGNSRLKEADVLAIREAYTPEFGALTKLANQFGVSKHQISHIVNRRQWTHI